MDIKRRHGGGSACRVSKMLQRGIMILTRELLYQFNLGESTLWGRCVARHALVCSPHNLRMFSCTRLTTASYKQEAKNTRGARKSQHNERSPSNKSRSCVVLFASADYYYSSRQKVRAPRDTRSIYTMTLQWRYNSTVSIHRAFSSTSAVLEINQTAVE